MSGPTLERTNQQFQKGDWVHVAKDLGKSMSHFENDCDAIVIGSYADQYGGNDHNSYTIHIQGRGQSSWYYGSQLTLIERARMDKLTEWKNAEDAEAKERGDLDWIFSHGDEVLKGAHGSTIAALGKCIGMNDLWGSRGEWFTYYANAMAILTVAEPFLKAGDKSGWLALSRK